MKKMICTLAIVGLQISCASKDLRNKAEQSGAEQARMDVTMEVIKEFSDDYNVLVQLNFKNNEGRWLRIDEVDFDLSNADNSPYNIIVGEDLVTWAQAKSEEKSIDVHNRNVMASAAGVGFGALAVIGVLNQNKGLTAAGLAGAAGSDAYRVTKNKIDEANALQRPVLLPTNHLYRSFTVPSQTYIKKWVLVNVPTGRISKMAKLNLKTIEGEKLQYTLYFQRPH